MKKMESMELSPENASRVFVTCCILHNILQTAGETEEVQLIDDMLNDADSVENSVSSSTADGEKKRKLLASALLS